MGAKGGTSKKKGPLAAIVDAGLLQDGEILRYITAKGVLLGVGLARRDGIEVEASRAPLGLSAFEAHCGSKAHRPCEFTFVTDDTNLLTLVAKEKGTWEGKEAPGSKLLPAEKRGAIPEWGLSRQAAANIPPVPLVEDLNDEYCRICWQGGELLCCESCPAVFHAECLKLDIVPEGDWHCPLCTCATCGHPNFGPRLDVDPGAGDKDVGDSAKGIVWVSAGTEGIPATWTGANGAGASRPAVGIHADTFDRLWPELGAKLAAVQNAEMAREAAAAAAAAAANPQPTPATAAGAKGVAGPGSLTKGKLVNGERKPKKINLGRFISMANRSETVATLTDSLESWSSKSGDVPLRDLFKTLCPDLTFKGVEAAVPVLAGLLWSMRGLDDADYDTEDDTPPGRKRARIQDEDFSPDSPMSPSRQRRPGSGMPQRFRDAIMLSDDDSPEPEPVQRGNEGANEVGHKSILGKRKRPPSQFDLAVLAARLQTLSGDLATPPPPTLQHQSTSANADSEPDVDILSTSPRGPLPVAIDLPDCAGHPPYPEGQSKPSAQHSTTLRGVNGAVSTASAAAGAVKAENAADGLMPADDWLKFLAGLPELDQAGTAPGLTREDVLIAERLKACLHESGYSVTPSRAPVTPGPGPAPTTHSVTVENIHAAFGNPHCVEAWAAHPQGPAIRYETAGTHAPGPALGPTSTVRDVSGAPVQDPRRTAVLRLLVRTAHHLAEFTGRPPELHPAVLAELGLPVETAANPGVAPGMSRGISGVAPQAARPLGPILPGTLGAMPPAARPLGAVPLSSVEPLGTVPSWFTPSGVAALANAGGVQVRPPCQKEPKERVPPPPRRRSPLTMSQVVSALLGDGPTEGRPMSADRDRAFAQLRTPSDPRPTTTPAHPTGATPLRPPDGNAAAVRALGPYGPTAATPYGGVRPPWAGRPVPSSDPRLLMTGLTGQSDWPEAIAAQQYRMTAMHAQPSLAPPLHPSEPHSDTGLAGPSPRDPRIQAMAVQQYQMTVRHAQPSFAPPLYPNEPSPATQVQGNVFDPLLAGLSPRDPRAMAAQQYRMTVMHAQPSFAPPLHPNEPYPANHGQGAMVGPGISHAPLMDPRTGMLAEGSAELTPLSSGGAAAAAGQAMVHQVPWCADPPSAHPCPSALQGQAIGIDAAAPLIDAQTHLPAPGPAAGHTEPGNLEDEAKESTTESWSELQSLRPSGSNPAGPVISSDEDAASADVTEPTLERAHIGGGTLAGGDVRPDSAGSSGSDQETSPGHPGVLASAEVAVRAVWVDEGYFPSDTASPGYIKQECDQPGKSSEGSEGVRAVVATPWDAPTAKGLEQAGQSSGFVSGSLGEANIVRPPPTSGFGPLAHSTEANLPESSTAAVEQAEVLPHACHQDVALAEDEVTAPEAIGGNEISALVGESSMEGVEPAEPPLPPSGSGPLTCLSAADLRGSAMEGLEYARVPSPTPNQDLAGAEDQVPAAEPLAVHADVAASTASLARGKEGSPPALLREPEQATSALETCMPPSGPPAILELPASEPAPSARLELDQGEATDATGRSTALEVQSREDQVAVNGMHPVALVCATSVMDMGVEGGKIVGVTEVLQTAGQESHTCMLTESLPPMARQPWQSGPRGLPPQGDAAFEVDCPSCLRRFHLGCLSESDQQKAVKEGGVWYCSPECLNVSASLAATCMRGVMACPPTADGIAVAWQLIRGASVASPKDCRGHAPQYPADATAELRKVLHAARHIAADALGTVNDCRSKLDLLPLLLAGTTSVDRRLDFSGFHTAVLWLGGTVASVAVVRALGTNLAEVPFIVTRPELRGNGLAAVLLGALEADLLSAGCQLVALPYVVLPSSSRNVPATRTSAAAEVPMPVEAWPRKVGYDLLTVPQSLRITGLPSLSFPGTALLSKELSVDTLIKVPTLGTLQLGPGCPVQALLKNRLLVAAPTAVSTPGGDVKADGASKKRRRAAADVKLENGQVAPEDDNDIARSKKARRGLNGNLDNGTVAPVAASVEGSPLKTTGRQQKVLGDLNGTACEGMSAEEAGDVGPADLPAGVGEDPSVYWVWEWEGMRQEVWQQGFLVPLEVEQCSLVGSE